MRRGPWKANFYSTYYYLDVSWEYLSDLNMGYGKVEWQLTTLLICQTAERRYLMAEEDWTVSHVYCGTQSAVNH